MSLHNMPKQSKKFLLNIVYTCAYDVYKYSKKLTKLGKKKQS